MSDKDLKVTLKSGTGYDAPWITVDADDPSELEMKLSSLLEGDVLKLTVDVANQFKGINNASPLTSGGGQPAPEPPKRGGWGNHSSNNSAPQQNNNAGGNVRYHPEGITCGQCGSSVQFKEFRSKAGKDIKLWTCPNQRSKGDGHYSEFAN